LIFLADFIAEKGTDFCFLMVEALIDVHLPPIEPRLSPTELLLLRCLLIPLGGVMKYTSAGFKGVLFIMGTRDLRFAPTAFSLPALDSESVDSESRTSV